MRHSRLTFAWAATTFAIAIAACTSAPTESKPKTVKSEPIGTTPIKPGETKPAADTPPGPSVVCTYGNSIREIAVVVDDDGCTVNYIKDGAKSTIASGGPESEKCREVQDVVRANLEKAGFTCQ